MENSQILSDTTSRLLEWLQKLPHSDIHHRIGITPLAKYYFILLVQNPQSQSVGVHFKMRYNEMKAKDTTTKISFSPLTPDSLALYNREC